jgi:peptidoglycan/LPS O-acetylase OafA/YrhL
LNLADHARSRDNNFTLIRVVASFIVLVYHCWSLHGQEPYRDFATPMGLSTARIALHVFFVISGFLITASLFSRDDIIGFASARFLRVFPGLWVMLIVTVGALGLFVGNLPAREFFASPITHDYLIRGATLVNGVRFYLPGLFDTNPYPLAVNGSLWTLPVEWRLYEYLAAGWVVWALRPSWRKQAFRLGLPLLAAVFLVRAYDVHQFVTPEDDAPILIAMFLYGATLHVWREKITLSWGLFAGLVAALALSFFNASVFFAVYLVAIPFVTLCVAYQIGGPLLAYNRFGDYSYGVYIYAFPIQQALMTLIPGISFAAYVVLSSLLTLVCAVLSWHFVERPALARKSALAAAIHKLLGLCRRRLAPLLRFSS